MISNKHLFTYLLALTLTITAMVSQAASPQSISYQAYLSDSVGLPITSTENMTFRLYDAPLGGNLLWSDTLSVNVIGGLLAAELGRAGNPLPKAVMADGLWLGIEIGSDGEAVPRESLSSNHYAYRAENSVTVGGRAEAELQRRITAGCPAGQAIVSIAADGSVNCENNADSMYNGANFTASNQSCSVGMVVTGVDSNGGFVCSTVATANATKVTDNNNTLTAHISNTANPHSVSPGQLGSVSSASLANHEASASTHHARYSDGEALGALAASDGPGSTFNSDAVDGITSSAFLRSNVGDTFSSGTLSFNPGTTVKLNGTAAIGSASSTDDDVVYFDNGSNEAMRWDDASNRFEFTDDLQVAGALTAGPTDASPATYNQFRSLASSAPVSNDMSSRGDLFIGYDLEVGGEIYADRILYMLGSAAAGADVDQTIYFYNADNRAGEYLRWNDFESRFDISAPLRVRGTLVTEDKLLALSDVHVAGNTDFQWHAGNVDNAEIDGFYPCELKLSGACEWSSFQLSCPAGTAIVSGGCTCDHPASNDLECYITDNLPITTSTWTCAAVSPVVGAELSISITCASLE